MEYRSFSYDILLTKIIKLLILHAFTVATLLQKQWRKGGEEDRMLDWQIFIYHTDLPHLAATMMKSRLSSSQWQGWMSFTRLVYCIELK